MSKFKDFDLDVKKVAGDIKITLSGNAKEPFAITYDIPTTGYSALCCKKKGDDEEPKCIP